MGLLSKRRNRRATRRAEAKALKVRAKTEAKLAARNDQRQFAARLKAEKKASAKADRSAAAQRRHEAKMAELATRKAEAGRINKANVKRAIGVGRILVPVAVPLLMQAATAARGALDARRAAKLGVAVDDIGNHTGHGAALSARVTAVGRSLDDLASGSRGRDAEVGRFVTSARAQLADATTAIRAAENLPEAQRRAAHASIAARLDRLDADVLVRLGVL